MNPLRRSPAGRVSRTFSKYREHRALIRDVRIIEQLPHRLRRDIGWPPYGDLDERSGY